MCACLCCGVSTHTLPLPLSLICFDVHRFSVPFLQEVFLLARPDKSMPRKWRMEAAESGFHEHISIAVPRTLDPEVVNELRGLDIDDLRLVDLRELAQIVGVSASGRKEEVKLRLTAIITS